MTEPEVIRAEGVSLVPVPLGASLDALEDLTGGRAIGRGWPHEDTGAGLAFMASGGWTWLIADAEGAIVGECGTKTPPDEGTVEIGYGLAAPSRGKGLGTRAVRALTDWLLALPDVHRVIAYVAQDNVASRRVVERLGYTVDGVEGGEVIYARDRSGGSAARPGKVHLSPDT